MLNLIGWTLSLASMFIVIFGSYPFQQLDTKLSPFHFGFFEGLGRVIWAISLCYIIFACVHGYGGPINRFLAHPFWQPISRLSYSIYLLHLPVIWLTMATAKSPLYFSELTAVSHIISLYFTWVYFFHYNSHFIYSFTLSSAIIYYQFLYQQLQH